MIGTRIRTGDRGSETAANVLHALGRAAEHGVHVDNLPAVQSARDTVARAAEIGSRLHHLRQGGNRDHTTELATALLDGDLDDAALLTAAANHLAATDPRSLLRSVAIGVDALANRRALAEL